MDIKTVIVFILSLGVIVLIHELGHLLVAKLFKVYCHEFAIGMGPKLWSKKIGETIYSLRAVPLGGYVLMAGEPNDEEFMPADLPKERRLVGIHPLKQIAVMLAGVAMNFILFIILTCIVVVNQGVATDNPSLTIGSIAPNSVAEKADLQINDTIVAVRVDGREVEVNDYQSFKNLEIKQVAVYIIERDQKLIEVTMMPQYDAASDRYLLGIGFFAVMQRVSVLDAVGVSFDFFAKNLVLIFTVLGNLFRGQGLENLTGPVGIFMVAGQVSQQGIYSILMFVAMLSLNVGVFNLLPIPALDGGRVILTLPELFGVKLNQKLKERLIVISFGLLLLLIFFIIFKDIVTFF